MSSPLGDVACQRGPGRPPSPAGRRRTGPAVATDANRARRVRLRHSVPRGRWRAVRGGLRRRGVPRERASRGRCALAAPVRDRCGRRAGGLLGAGVRVLAPAAPAAHAGAGGHGRPAARATRGAPPRGAGHRGSTRGARTRPPFHYDVYVRFDHDVGSGPSSGRATSDATAWSSWTPAGPGGVTLTVPPDRPPSYEGSAVSFAWAVHARPSGGGPPSGPMPVWVEP